MKTYKTVGEYMKGIPKEYRGEFESTWKAICALVPECEEAIRYGMPTIRFKGKNLVHFAVMKEHFGFYPTSSGVRAFQQEIEGVYSYDTGTIRFPFGKKLPIGLMKRIVKFRVAEERRN